jgi:hypothetical protein
MYLVNAKKCLKIPKEQSESIYRRRTDNTMAECNYSVHVRTVQLKSVLFTVKNRVEHYLHLGLHGKGNRP